jgi:hypothetical protein
MLFFNSLFFTLQRCDEVAVDDVCYDQSCSNITVPVFKKQCRYEHSNCADVTLATVQVYQQH